MTKQMNKYPPTANDLYSSINDYNEYVKMKSDLILEFSQWYEQCHNTNIPNNWNFLLDQHRNRGDKYNKVIDIKYPLCHEKNNQYN